MDLDIKNVSNFYSARMKERINNVSLIYHLKVKYCLVLVCLLSTLTPQSENLMGLLDNTKIQPDPEHYVLLNQMDTELNKAPEPMSRTSKRVNTRPACSSAYGYLTSGLSIFYSTLN